MAGEAGPPGAPRARDEYALDAEDGERLVLGDLINRVLDKGVVISGHVTISVADIDLIALDLRLLITSIQTAIERAGVPGSPLSRDPADADVPLLPPDSRGRP
ncbi:MAG: gas vesicle protein [Gemmatimonadaceae bacterium]